MGIRNEQPEDIEKIWHIHVKAFDTEAEANLVNNLRSTGIPFSTARHDPHGLRSG